MNFLWAPHHFCRYWWISGQLLSQRNHSICIWRNTNLEIRLEKCIIDGCISLNWIAFSTACLCFSKSCNKECCHLVCSVLGQISWKTVWPIVFEVWVADVCLENEWMTPLSLSFVCIFVFTDLIIHKQLKGNLRGNIWNSVINVHEQRYKHFRKVWK